MKLKRPKKLCINTLLQKNMNLTQKMHILNNKKLQLIFFKKYDYFLIYHPKYIYDHDNDITLDNNPWKKFKVLITKEMNEKDFNYQDAEEPDLSSRQINLTLLLS